MMRSRQKQQPQRYPRWSKEDSPARQCKARDGYTCIVCGAKDRTLIVDAAGQPSYILYLHAAHLNELDPLYYQVEPIEGQRLAAMCPRDHRLYDLHWQARAEVVEHERRKHRIVRERRATTATWAWLLQRCLEVR